MNEKLKWVLELVNRVTGPSRQIQESINNVAASAQKLKQASEQASGGVSSLGSSFGGLSRGVAAGQLAANAISSIARAAWEASKSLAMATLEAASFKENTLIGLKVLLKSESQAKAVYAEAESFAAKTPFNTQDVLKLYKTLITSGFSIEKNAKGISEVSALAETIGNAAAANGMSPDVIAGITKAIGDVKMAGKLRGQEMIQFSNWGVGRAPIFEALAKTLGKKVEDIPKLMEAGQIDAATAINAVVTSIGGTYGGLMKETSTTLSGLWSTLASRPFEILSALADTDAFDTLKQLVSSLAELFAPGGEAASSIQGFLRGTIQKLFDVLFGWAKNAEGKITPASLQAGLKKLAEWFGRIWERATPTIETIKTLAASFVDMITGLQNGEGTFANFVNLMTRIGSVISVFVGIQQFIFDLALTVGGFMSFVLEKLMGIPALFLEIWDSVKGAAYNLGTAIWQGMTDGIKSGAGWVKDSVVGLASGAYDGVAGYLGIQSPSRLFKELGQYTALGYAGGIDKGAAAVNEAALAMVEAPNFTGAGASFAAGSSGALAGSVSNKPSVTLNIVINGSTSPEQMGETKDAVVGMLSEAFEELGWELGLAPQ
jgi:tape measure domain-containing protein